MFAQSYLNTSIQIISDFKGEEPLASFLKKFFAANKKYGSRDRKQIAHLCYCYYRLGKSLHQAAIEERILAALFLCSTDGHPLLTLLKPQWNDYVAENIKAKIEILQRELKFIIEDIFPFYRQLSDTIDFPAFASAFLCQPDTYIRIRPDKEAVVKQKLGKAAIPFVATGNHCLAVSPLTKLETVLKINAEVVVQDANSQKVLSSLNDYIKDKNRKLDVWDCCAASGGKSILLSDIFPNSKLTVSDIRPSILANLRKRFLEAGIDNYKWFVADVSSGAFNHEKYYDLVICDAPCTGSGTWARTPEQLYFFKEEKIDYYTALQKKIVSNSSRYLKKEGMFLYITCSVFKEENERMVDYIQKHCSLTLQSTQYIGGYGQKADTLFTALFVR